MESLVTNSDHEEYQFRITKNRRVSKFGSKKLLEQRMAHKSLYSNTYSTSVEKKNSFQIRFKGNQEITFLSNMSHYQS